ncbi:MULTISPECIES: aldo/keto reductase [Streptomyces]|uniref:Aldo/keto reductase n=1 Tax=Streptomyces luteosporeus TaxID=173856 RepID=A0ABN3TWD5_9ACTN
MTRTTGTGLAPRTLAGGLRVHPVGIGCWAIGGPGTNLGLPMGWSTASDTASLRGLDAAFELGANLFDTADVYGHGHSERLIGRFLKGVPREQVVLSTKVGYFTGTAEHAYHTGHMRRQLETSLENLGTDRLDIYFLHNADFGPDDRYLAGAIETMRTFQREGLIRAVGMRGPHRYATERVRVPKAERADKHSRFRQLFAAIEPQYLAVRYNALTPAPGPGQVDIFDFAAAHGVSILVNKPLCQGLLTGKHSSGRPPQYGEGDHRLRKAWFTPGALEIIQAGLEPLRERFGASERALVRMALRYCLQRAPHVAVLAGFTTPEQVRQNLTCLGTPLTDEDLAVIRDAGARIQQALDASGEVFLDEKDARR